MGFDFEIQYRPGKENGVADALSRKMTFSALSSVHFKQIKDWETEIHHDPKLQGIIHDLIQDIKSHPGYKFQNQKLFYKGRLGLPKGSSRIPLLLQEFHNSAVGGIRVSLEPTNEFQTLFIGRECGKTSNNM